MDTGIERVRELPIKQMERNTDTRDQLAHAARYARGKRLQDYFVVDVDSHLFENQSWGEIVEFIPDPVVRDIAKNFKIHGQITPGIIQASGWPTHQNVGGRIPHDPGLEEKTEPNGVHRDVVLARRAMDSMMMTSWAFLPRRFLWASMAASKAACLQESLLPIMMWTSEPRGASPWQTMLPSSLISTTLRSKNCWLSSR